MSDINKNILELPVRTVLNNLPITLVIPVRDEADGLSELFQRISDLESHPTEVVFVFTGHDPAIPNAINEFGKYMVSLAISLRVITRPGFYPGAARNLGVEAASQPWIAFVDAGIFPSRKWLSNLWSLKSMEGLDAVFGMCRFHTDHYFGCLICALSYGCGRLRPVLPASLFNRDVFDKIGFFEVHLRSGEDLMWCDKLRNSGIRFGECPGAIVEYQQFPADILTAARKWFTYEQSAAVAGVGGIRRTMILAIVFVFYLLTLSGVAVLFVPLIIYIVFRGVVDPMRRSNTWKWWRYWGQPFAIIPVAALIDLAAIIGRLSGLLGLSAFRVEKK